MNTHQVYDTFNRRVVSKHKSLMTAVKAENRFLNAVRRANGKDSYLPTRIQRLVDGVWLPVDPADVDGCRYQAGLR